MRSRAVFAAVTFGAIAAATIGQSLVPHHSHTTALADPGMSIGTNSQSLDVAPVQRGRNASAEAQQIAASQRITGQQSVDTLVQTGTTTGATFAAPAAGTVVSTFGGQYGSFRYGIEIKNVKNTPIVAAASGTIIAAGPTSGFGLWVKEQLPDGTTLVYARMNTYSVQVGQHVAAGQQIARMGDRGFSQGYTLHFEVWDPTGKKIDPMAWLNQRGITV
ncbi:MAG TPA: M23 family metallopeptidase [Pseudonocardiaceae bacterium]|nr:M23 family metallopeptidase [Pseudonocardiaceae bacterium]